MIIPATGLDTPAFSILEIICGSTDSDELVPSTVNNSSLIKRRNFHRLKPLMRQMGPSTKITNTMQVR
ncbi:hypothetical protein D3C75_1128440 [compost metagenome]